MFSQHLTLLRYQAWETPDLESKSPPTSLLQTFSKSAELLNQVGQLVLFTAVAKHDVSVIIASLAVVDL